MISDDETSLCSEELLEHENQHTKTCPKQSLTKKRSLFLSVVSFDESNEKTFSATLPAKTQKSKKKSKIQYSGRTMISNSISQDGQPINGEPILYRLAENFPDCCVDIFQSEGARVRSPTYDSWDSIRMHVASNPHELTWQDPYDGWNALHWLLFRGAPVEVIKNVLYRTHDHDLKDESRFLGSGFSHAQSLLKHSTVSAKTRRGSTALHIACYFASSFSVIELLLQHNPSAACAVNDRNETPIFCALSAKKEAVIEERRKSRAASFTTIQSLLEAGNLSDIFRPNIDGSTVLKEACERWIEAANCGKWIEAANCGKMVKKRKSQVLDSLESSSIGKVENSRSRQAAWQILLLVVEAGYSHIMTNPFYFSSAQINRHNQLRAFPLLHALIELECPSQVVVEALHSYPSLAKKVDSRGWLPLHVACQISTTNTSWKSSILELLVAANPDTVSMKTQDVGRTLPLHLALQSKDALFTSDRTYALGKLIDTFPQALYTREERNKLYPFMLPGAILYTGPPNLTEESRTIRMLEQTNKINATYYLLKEAPDIIERFSKSGNDAALLHT